MRRRLTSHSLGGLVSLGAVTALLLLLLPTSCRATMFGAFEVSPAPSGSRYVSPHGSDQANGTADHPWRTLRKAANAAQPGDTIILSPGVYGRRGLVHRFDRGGTAAGPITFRTMAGARPARILGSVKITGSYLRFVHLVFAGPTGEVKPVTPDNPHGENVQVSIGEEGVDIAQDVRIYHCTVRNSHWHAGIYVEDADDIQIVGNYIHNNGDPNDPGQANQSHGIYWSSGSGGLIANNLIKDNVARGIQLYPEAYGLTVIYNTIVSNGAAGIQLGEGSSYNQLANNIIAFNGNAAIRPASLWGSDNDARHNLQWDNGENTERSTGLTLSDALLAPPLFGPGYKLRPNSMAVNNAANQWLVPSDYMGVHRPLGTQSDLGAFESW